MPYKVQVDIDRAELEKPALVKPRSRHPRGPEGFSARLAGGVAGEKPATQTRRSGSNGAKRASPSIPLVLAAAYRDHGQADQSLSFY
jgi:hypothetical protein